ncbi:ectonucleotide pyrophosphatase/phosphodiesterase [uncultured Draconibacterium sp.]|uniref:alkaline phosphatase family protein n=1 Tax=uncultured Draconibacterium sp. TaxID=1573823 RepID=UPI002AA8EBB0|nr:ectonucleotide pyrophosphatase/phosphodiesterase [uncultured Draconibacterium sp.]
MLRIIFLTILIAGLQCSLSAKKKDKAGRPYVVMLSMDAFRWDYPELYNTPNLDSIAKVGVKAKSLEPCFPSKTFPNHYSMATGLYPENHGIVQNNFIDPELGAYRLGDREAVQNADFYGGEPIWVTAEKQGVNAACYFWPGSEAPVKGIYPSVWKKYDGSVPFKARVDSVISWLNKPIEQRPHLIMWYLQEPDGVSHEYGPKSKETKEMVESIDRLIGYFCREINKLSIADSINLIFTADHGMGEISPEKAISLEEHVKEKWISDVKGANPVLLLRPASKEYVDSIQHALANIKELDCWKKEEVPVRLHYRNNDRIYDVVCAAHPGWSIYWKTKNYGSGGTHGFDPAFKDMHAVFYAAGPAFRKDYIHQSFINVDLYSLLTEILYLKPAKTDGNLKNVKGMLIGKTKKR